MYSNVSVFIATRAQCITVAYFVSRPMQLWSRRVVVAYVRMNYSLQYSALKMTTRVRRTLSLIRIVDAWYSSFTLLTCSSSSEFHSFRFAIFSAIMFCISCALQYDFWGFIRIILAICNDILLYTAVVCRTCAYTAGCYHVREVIYVKTLFHSVA